MYRFGAYLVLLVLLLAATTKRACATHIIGGELSYVHLGNFDYEMTLKLYRDCGPGNTNGTGFDPTITIAFFNSANNLLSSMSITGPVISVVPAVTNNPCLTPPPVCVEEAIYIGIVQLNPVAGGITAAYQRCCRNPTILNLNAPNVQGITTVAFIPDTTLVVNNSSPHFVDFPPIAICVNDTLDFDHSAFDADGDILVYSLCDPFQGASPGAPNPFPAAPPYNTVTWATGFSALNPLTGGATIDPTSGVLSVYPTLLGQYVVGVCVQEFRNGNLLSEVKRDFQFNVTTCILNTTSAVQSQQLICDGLTVDFINLSVSSVAYKWDFGVAGISSDTSNLFQPSYTFPDTGTYNVTLIANPTWPCADTSYAIFEVYWPLNPNISAPGISCFDAQPLELEVSGNFTSSAVVDWDLGPQAVSQFMSGTPILANWVQPGYFEVNVSVSEHGCSDTDVDSVIVFPNPIADFTWDPQGCEPFTSDFVNNSSAWTTMQYTWDFGDGTNSTDENPSHLYNLSATYDISLTVITDSGCVDTATMFVPNGILVQPRPIAGFSVSPLEVNVLDPLITVTDESVSAINWEYLVNGLAFYTPDFSHVFSGGGYFTITQTVTNDVGCSDTAIRTVTVRDHLFYAPNAFTPDGDGVNDLWMPSAQGALEYELMIFDRWGQLVFETEDAFTPWSGADHPLGTYQYHVKIRSAGGFPHAYAGHFNLIR